MDDHERFLLKNKSMAKGYSMSGMQDKLEKKLGDDPSKPRTMSCFNCRKKNKCTEFKSKSSGGASGVVSIGPDTTFLCDKYQPFQISAKEKPLTKKQVNNIMKAARKGRL